MLTRADPADPADALLLGGDNPNAVHPGWLSNAGFGLRIVSARAAFSKVLQVDIALPLNTTPDVEKLLLLLKTKTRF